MDDNKLDYFIENLGKLFYLADQNSVKVLDPSRYQLMKQTSEKLKETLKDDLIGNVTIKLERMFNSGAVSAELIELNSDSPYLFAEILLNADNLDIYPLTNGHLKLSLTFHGVFKTIK